ncbi:OLC1v1028075C1 [Oldenlandia corymbosa var. corymbosa]|uniref:OLC1v1028075C1 n=1 Tax=Oldenlandia corymbosa var. corymbosa TaxID=529605 RepID=A0AAV1CAW1_OLDCO|nr:OLC1v1028075C1 [Oldenlandia corymbosa var. corymbosa]
MGAAGSGRSSSASTNNMPHFQNSYPSHTSNPNSALTITNLNHNADQTHPINHHHDDPNNHFNYNYPNHHDPPQAPEPDFLNIVGDHDDHHVLYNYGGGAHAADDEFVMVDHHDHDVVEVEHEHQVEDDETFFGRLPAGYKFEPTDVELLRHYLYNKVHGLPLPRNRILDFNLYDESPESIKGKYPSINNRWYVFTSRQKKYPKGYRPSRSAPGGFWKATGADVPIRVKPGVEELGYRKSLVYHKGKPPHGTKTGWIMHEFKLKHTPAPANGANANHMRLDDCVLCRLYKKPEPKESPNRPSSKAARKEKGGSSSKAITTTTATQNEYETMQNGGQNFPKFAAPPPPPPPSHHIYDAGGNNGVPLLSAARSSSSSSYDHGRLLNHPTLAPPYPPLLQTSSSSVVDLPSIQCHLACCSQLMHPQPQPQGYYGAPLVAAGGVGDGYVRREDYLSGRYNPFKSSFFTNSQVDESHDGFTRQEDELGHHVFPYNNYSSFANNPPEADEIYNMLASSPPSFQQQQFPSGIVLD